MEPAAIERFVHDWHHGSWSVAGLPALIDARVAYFSSGRRLLGCCDVRHGGTSTIALNAALLGTALYTPVLAHECAHILLEEHGLRLCYADDRTERAVWQLAARLAVPRDAVAAVQRGEMCTDGLARLYELPEAFVRYATNPNNVSAWLDTLKLPPPPPKSMI